MDGPEAGSPCGPIADARAREWTSLRGRVVALTVQPRGSAPSVRATLEDASGRIDAVFVGRRHLPGVEPGREIEIEGRVYEHDLERCVFNPRYQLLTGQR